MNGELGFSQDECGKMTTSVLIWSDADLDRLWILKLECVGWKVADLRSKPEADEFDPNDYFVDVKNLVSHRNIGAWIRTCQEKARKPLDDSGLAAAHGLLN